MRILVTGADGFIGKNLTLRLSEHPAFDVEAFTRQDSVDSLRDKLTGIDTVIHLAGINRPDDEAEFAIGNRDFTILLCEALKKLSRPVHVLFASSIQAELGNPYGTSKKESEQALANFATETGSQVSVFRLPNVFGKWCKPEYNSVVATFCHHIANGKPIDIHDPETILRLVYIDDVIAGFIQAFEADDSGLSFCGITPEYEITLGKLAMMLHAFRDSRENLLVGEVGVGLTRALYATYLSYLKPEKFSYPLQPRKDDRGAFVEILKTPDCGQFSYFTAGPGVTRGGHYHHTKNEKFLVVQGQASFRFRHLVTTQTHEIRTSAAEPEIVETIPGWVHDITNTGDSDLVVLLWANENFDEEYPDTVRADIDE